MFYFTYVVHETKINENFELLHFTYMIKKNVLNEIKNNK